MMSQDKSLNEEKKKDGKESAKAIFAFATYCDLGVNRSLVKLQTELVKQEQPMALKTLKLWSRTWGWQARVREYDLGVAAELRARKDKAIEDMNDRHIKLAINQQLKMLGVIEELMKRKKIGAYAASTLLKYATDLERLARGAPTEQTKLDVGFDGEQPLVIKTVWDRALTDLPTEDKTAQQEEEDE